MHNIMKYKSDDPAWMKVPPHLRAGLDRWIMDGIEPGAFLQAVLRNDLYHAWLYGDEEAKGALMQMMTFFHKVIPQGAWGSSADYIRWRGLGGINGKDKVILQPRGESDDDGA